MAYYEYLRGILEPLGIYDLDSGVGGAELRALGAELDEILEMFEHFGREILPLTAEDFGMEGLEELFPYRPSFISLDDRRRAITALLRIRNGCFSVDALCDTLSGCGIDARVAESGLPMTVDVFFPSNRGVPEGIENIKQRIERILPCHLAVRYCYTYCIWMELMREFGSWRALMERCGSWRLLEILSISAGM